MGEGAEREGGVSLQEWEYVVLKEVCLQRRTAQLRASPTWLGCVLCCLFLTTKDQTSGRRKWLQLQSALYVSVLSPQEPDHLL